MVVHVDLCTEVDGNHYHLTGNPSELNCTCSVAAGMRVSCPWLKLASWSSERELIWSTDKAASCSAFKNMICYHQNPMQESRQGINASHTSIVAYVHNRPRRAA